MEQFNFQPAPPETTETLEKKPKSVMERLRTGASSKLKVLTAAVLMSMGGTFDAKAETGIDSKEKNKGDMKSISLDNAFAVGSPVIRVEDEPEVINQIQEMFEGLTAEELGQIARNPNMFMEVRGSSDQKPIAGSGIEYVNEKGEKEVITTNAELTAKRIESIKRVLMQAIDGINHPNLRDESDEKYRAALMKMIREGRLVVKMPPGGVLTRDQIKLMYPEEAAGKTDAELDDMARFMELAITFESYEKSIDKIIEDLVLYDDVTFLFDVSGSMQEHYTKLHTSADAVLPEIPETTTVSAYPFGARLLSEIPAVIESKEQLDAYIGNMQYVRGEVAEDVPESLLPVLMRMPEHSEKKRVVHVMTDEALQKITLGEMKGISDLAKRKGVDVKFDMRDHGTGAFFPVTAEAIQIAIKGSFQGVRPDVPFIVTLSGGVLSVTPDVSSGRSAQQVNAIAEQDSN